MATLEEIGVSAFINIMSIFMFVLAFSVLRIQPANEKIYFSKGYIKGERRFVNNRNRNYFASFFNWIPAALKTSESEIITHAGFDSAIFLRIFTLGLKIFLPITIVSLLLLVPILQYSNSFNTIIKKLFTSDVNDLSMSTFIPDASGSGFYVYVALEQLFTMWVCYVLYNEYSKVAKMRLNFLTSQNRHAKHYTVLARNVPLKSGTSTSNAINNFFQENYPQQYLFHQAVYKSKKFDELARRRTSFQDKLEQNRIKFEKHPDERPTEKIGFLGLWGKKVDSIEYYEQKVQDVTGRMSLEREEMMNDESAVLPAGFISFNSQWGAVVAAQTQQHKNPTKWLTCWAPEPNDICWRNLEIKHASLGLRKMLVSFFVFALVLLYMIPIFFVQSLAYMEHLEHVSPLNLKPLIQLKILKLVIQGFLPGLVLQLFLFVLEKLVIFLSKMEGHVAVSEIERQAAAKYYYFMLLNVILGSVVAGTAFEELRFFFHHQLQLPTKIVKSMGGSLPRKATFFITYIMVDGWAGTASEILQPMPLLLFHLKKLLFSKRKREREEGEDQGQGIDFTRNLARISLYFLLGFGYALYNPILLPFVDLFFGFAYLIYRHQIINVYNQRSESVGGFWPHLHTRFVAGMLISQLVLFALFTAVEATYSNLLLLLPPISTFFFHKYCKKRFEPAFTKYSLKEAMTKDAMEQSRQPNFNLQTFIGDSYLNPIVKSVIEEQQQQQLGSAVESSTQNSPSPSQSRSVAVYGHHPPPEPEPASPSPA